jgi:tetratricopeptide (TPR) repeat protein
MLAFLLLNRAQPMFMFSETQNVPVSRLLINLETRLKANTNDVQLLYWLGRIHAMAYSTNLQEFPVIGGKGPNVWRKGEPSFGYPGADKGFPDEKNNQTNWIVRVEARQHLTNAINYYTAAASLALKKLPKTNDWIILPIYTGYAWCLSEAGRKEEAIAAYRRALQIAWQREVEGETTLKEMFQDSWDKIRAGKNPFGARRRPYLGPGISFSEQIIPVLIKLLDPRKDAKEIAQLQADKATLASMGRAITPIVIPLSSQTSLEELVNENASIPFDLDGSGLVRRWGWITPGAGWLVYDENSRVQIRSALQLFGNVTFWVFWENGYQALAALDDDGDGFIRGEELRGLALWQDLNSNGISESGEVLSLEEWGITGLSYETSLHPSGILWSPNGVQLRDGSNRPSFDWIAASH